MHADDENHIILNPSHGRQICCAECMTLCWTMGQHHSTLLTRTDNHGSLQQAFSIFFFVCVSTCKYINLIDLQCKYFYASSWCTVANVEIEMVSIVYILIIEKIYNYQLHAMLALICCNICYFLYKTTSFIVSLLYALVCCFIVNTARNAFFF